MKLKFPREILCRVRSIPAPHHKSAIVTTAAPMWNARLHKNFTYPKVFHVSDPTGAVRAGDTIAIARWPALGSSHRITHTVTRIVAAWGADGAARPSERNPVWTEEERRDWQMRRLLERGTLNTKRGLRDGWLRIGEEGKIEKVEPEERERGAAWRAVDGWRARKWRRGDEGRIVRVSKAEVEIDSVWSAVEGWDAQTLQPGQREAAKAD